MSKPTLPNHKIVVLAASAGCDIATARKYMLGEPVRGEAGDRVASAVDRLGYRQYVRGQSQRQPMPIAYSNLPGSKS